MNYEIELKAHVYNREEVIQILNRIAEYKGHTEKKDTYYHINNISCRIRKEDLSYNDQISSSNIFTYKQKEIKHNQDGTQLEVNQENEFTFSDCTPFEVFLKDAGAEIFLVKEKKVEQWLFTTEGETAHIELCTVPPLGDFLEIEIIKEQNDSETVLKCKNILQGILTTCNIPLSQIEDRYYKDLLKDVSITDKN